MKLRNVLIVVLLAGCAGAPEDAFVGVYNTSVTCDNRVVETGERLTSPPETRVVRIEKALDGSIFFPGSTCTFPLVVVSTDRAEFAPTSCPGTLDDGTPVTVDLVGGGFNRREDPNITITLRSVIRAPSWTIESTCTYIGLRTE